jgi:hypothetical protein
MAQMAPEAQGLSLLGLLGHVALVALVALDSYSLILLGHCLGVFGLGVFALAKT